MDEEEARAYFEDNQIEVRMLKHYIDYENIEKPIQTMDDNGLVYPVNLDVSS